VNDVSREDSTDLSLQAFWIGVATVLMLFGLWITSDISKPWIGAHDWNGAAWTTAARHLIERPISETRMGVSLDHGSSLVDPKAFYVHHPPLIVWLMAAAYKLFGVSEMVGRAIPAAFTMFGAVCLVGLTASLGGRRAGLMSLIAFLAMPSQLYYGRMPNHEPIALPFMIAAAWAALSWSHRASAISFLLCLLAIALGCLSSWAAFFFAAVLGVAALLGMPRGRALFLGIGIASFAVLVFLFWHIRTVRADGWTDLLAAFFQRSKAVGLGEWLTTEAHWLSRLLTPVGAAAALLHLGRFVRLRSGAEIVILPLAVAGWANVLLFRQGAFVHEYYCYFLGAPAAAVVGLALAREGTKNLAAMVLSAMILTGLLVASDLRNQQSKLYASDFPESRRFIADLGRQIAEVFPADAKVLVDVQPIGEHLAFYADRRMKYLAETTEADLAKVVAEVDGVVGNTRLAVTRELLDRVLTLAARRIESRREFTVEGHTFVAVKFRK
jgi:hypothetical protein